MLRYSATWIILLLSISSATPGLAQRQAVGGIAGGAVNSNFGNANTSSKWGATVGAFGAFRASRNTIITLEGNWTQKGADNTRINYIEVPLMFGGVVQTGNGVGVRVYAGFEVDFKVACDSEDILFNCNNARSTLWSVPLGILIGRTSPSGTFTALDIRYDFTLTDTFSNIPNLWNRAWYFRLVIGMGQRR